ANNLPCYVPCGCNNLSDRVFSWEKMFRELPVHEHDRWMTGSVVYRDPSARNQLSANSLQVARTNWKGSWRQIGSEQGFTRSSRDLENEPHDATKFECGE